MIMGKEEERIDAIQKHGGMHLKTFKKKNITYEMCLVAVEKTGYSLEYVPVEFRTRELILKAVKRNGEAIRFVSEEQITEEMCRVAVQQTGLALMYVPSEFKTHDLCAQAVEDEPEVIKYVPVDIINAQFCLDVFHQSGISVLSILPVKYRNAPLYAEVIDLDPTFIYDVPSKFRTAKLVTKAFSSMGYLSFEEAVRADPELFYLIPSKNYSHELCQVFSETDGFTFMCLNYESDKGFVTDYGVIPTTAILRWPDICQEAVRRNGSLLEVIPEELLSYSMCYDAVSEGQYGYALNMVPSKYKTQEIYDLAFGKSKWNIEYIPAEYLTEEMCEAAVAEIPQLL